MFDTIERVVIDQLDGRLGRHLVHDPKSKDYRAEVRRTGEPLRSVQHRRYDPYPEPNQPVGCCTGVAEAMMANTVGNRVKGEVLGMDKAIEIYSRATKIDPFIGTYPPSDTGSSGLAAAKVAVQIGIASRYEWHFGIDEVLLGLQDHPVSIGGYWFWDMFDAHRKNPIVTPTGGQAGGHQWLASGYDAKREIVWGECWWGADFGINGRFGISVKDLRFILEQGGDAHYTYRKLS